jgi:hypothetical protein
MGASEAVRTMSTLVKVVVALVTGVLVLVTFVWMSFEREYGGQDAVSGVAIGHLADGSAELRELTWPGLGPEESTEYEVSDEDGVSVVRLVDHEGAVLFSGTAGEVTAWLDAQGPVLFTGTYAEVVDHRRSLQESDQHGFPVWLVPVWMVPLLVAVLAGRRDRRRAEAAS